MATLRRDRLVLPGAALAVAGAALLVLGLCLAVFGNVLTMPSYLAGWLFLAAVPFGALPLVMALELTGLNSVGYAWVQPLTLVLRRQLLLAPLAAVLAIPLLMRMAELYRHGPLHTPFGRAWMTPWFFDLRVVVYLILWSGLAVIFAALPRAGARRGFATGGLALHLIIATFAATDLAMAVEPGWKSSDFGVLLMAAQCVIALSCAILRLGAMARAGHGARTDLTRWDRARTRLAQAELHGAGLALLALTGIWMFVGYTQFEVIWSADMPAEIIWYIHRDAGGGTVVEWIGFIGGFIVPLIVLPTRLPGAAPLAAMVLLVVQALDMLWLITPAFRSAFTITGIDVVEMLGMIGIGLGVLLLLDLGGSRQREIEPAQPKAAAGATALAGRSAGFS